MGVNIGIGEASTIANLGRYYKIPNIPGNVKEIFTTNDNVFYILENGDVYASGNAVGLGRGRDDRSKAFFIERLNIPPIMSSNCSEVGLYNMSSYTHIPMFVGKDSKIYTTGHPITMFGERNIQTNFTRVATNVRQFTRNAYVDFDNNLWVAGANSQLLGLRR